VGSEFTGKCFFDFASLPFSGAFERFNGAGVIVMQNGVELIGQTRVKIVTDHLCFRPVNNADRALEPFVPQMRRNIDIVAQVQKEIRHIDPPSLAAASSGAAGVVKKRLITIDVSGTHILAFRRSVPIRRRGDRSVVSGEANGDGFFVERFAHELAEIEFAAIASATLLIVGERDEDVRTNVP